MTCFWQSEISMEQKSEEQASGLSLPFLSRGLQTINGRSAVLFEVPRGSEDLELSVFCVVI